MKASNLRQSAKFADHGLPFGPKFHKHFDPTILNSAFKLISDEYGVERGICQYAIHYRPYKDLVAVHDMSFAFDCPDTEEGFYAIPKSNYLYSRACRVLCWRR